MSFRQKRIETPLLKAYLNRPPKQPPYVPAWVTPAAFLVFVLSLGLFWLAPVDGILAIMVAGVVCWAFVWFLRARRAPKTEEEVRTQRAIAVIRNLAFHRNGNGLNRRVAPEVLIALEEAVSAHALATARWTSEDSEAYPGGAHLLDSHLYNCFRIAAPLVRFDPQPVRDWKAVCSNKELVNGIVEAIRTNTDRLVAFGGGAERKAALKELESVSADQNIRFHLGGSSETT